MWVSKLDLEKLKDAISEVKWKCIRFSKKLKDFNFEIKASDFQLKIRFQQDFVSEPNLT